ncbi:MULTISPECIES: hypothetical protein [unclassified Deinococcus]|uniref:hypothetical protein n=1 Tax=unclassified Deinococcus TaxID=2623546 RepID=UPI001C300D68|nr:MULTISPECIES: hypothetical protein [unclassified Deinococcus]MDK2013518.1 hypothetical protein [Deinococcus sp. 43]
MTARPVPVYAAPERTPCRPGRAARRWQVFCRRQWPFVLLAAGFVGVMVFAVSVAEVAPHLRGRAALGLLISALLSMRGLQSAPGGWRTYLDLPGDRS